MEEKEILDAVSMAEETPAEAIVEDPATETADSTPEAEGSGKKPMSKKKKILNGIFLGVQIALVLIAIILTLVMILNPKQGEVSSAGIKLLPVLSDSMDGERVINGETYNGFPPGALVIATTPKNGGADLKVGDIVTFMQHEGSTTILNTHRIVEVVEIESGVIKYRTQGDNPAAPVDSTLKLPGDIKAVYYTHINGLGKALTWVRDGYHFIYVIIIPLGLLLIYNIYLVAQIVVEGKMKKAKAAAAETAKQAALASIDEEEIKRKAIEEYLRSQAAAAGGGSPNEDGDKE